LRTRSKGNVLDERVKDLVAKDPKLSMLQDAERGEYGPDWIRTDISKNPNEPAGTI
jgi:hypothetical protein